MILAYTFFIHHLLFLHKLYSVKEYSHMGNT